MVETFISTFIKAVVNYLTALMVKKEKNHQIEQTMNEVKNAKTEQDFKNAANKLDDLNR